MSLSALLRSAGNAAETGLAGWKSTGAVAIRPISAASLVRRKCQERTRTNPTAMNNHLRDLCDVIIPVMAFGFLSNLGPLLSFEEKRWGSGALRQE